MSLISKFLSLEKPENEVFLLNKRREFRLVSFRLSGKTLITVIVGERRCYSCSEEWITRCIFQVETSISPRGYDERLLQLLSRCFNMASCSFVRSFSRKICKVFSFRRPCSVQISFRLFFTWLAAACPVFARPCRLAKVLTPNSVIRF